LDVVRNLTAAYSTLHALCEVFGGKQCLEALKGGVEETLNDELYASKFAEALAAHFHEQRLVDGSAMLFFKLSRAKDVFEAFYRKHLATRLLGTSADAEAERAGVSALEQECGAAYVTKLEGMCKDVDSSRVIRDDYAAATQKSTAAVELVPTVLTTGYWPNYSTLALELRPELLERKVHFEKHYAAKFQGRRLAWHHALERCVVRAKFLAARKDVDASLTQALVLVCFDGAAPGTNVTLDAIQHATRLDDDEVKHTLKSLTHAKVKVLRKDSETAFSVHAELWAYAKNRLKLVGPRQSAVPSVAADRDRINDAVQRDRQYAVDAAVVRIMKSRKTLSHHDLIAELFKSLKHSVTPAAVKLRLESLIEREYLERDAHDAQRYNYLA
jgi:cullin-4